MRQLYLFIVTREGRALSDILETAGISGDVRPGHDGALPSCLIYGDADGMLMKCSAWILTGRMEEENEPRLKDVRGIAAWRRLEVVDLGRAHPGREVVVGMASRGWVDKLARLMCRGFRPLNAVREPAVISHQLATTEIFMTGHAVMTDAELLEIAGEGAVVRGLARRELIGIA